jgi:heme exporter protein CcmD
MTEFLRMGGDGAYVWSAYGITLAAVVANVWWARRRHHRALERAREFAATDRVRKQPTVRKLK